jgi:TIR domain
MDVQAIQGAEDFVATMEREIERSDALIAVIGPDWTGGAARRMANPSDHVRRELEIALAAGVAIVPVLVWRAEVPPDRDLPESLRHAARLNAIELRDSQWAADAAALIDRLRRMAWAGAPKPPEPGGLAVRATVPLVSDNNFAPSQFTRFLLFAAGR